MPLNLKNRLYLQVGRIKLLRNLALLDGSEEAVYDRFTRLAGEVINAPISLITMVAANYQFFKSMVGLPEPWASHRRTPLSHSFCQHVVGDGKALVVTDAREVDFLKDNSGIPDLKIIGYLGIPLQFPDYSTLGSFCVIDSQPRAWTACEIEIMTELAAIISHEFDIRAMAHMDKSYQPNLKALHTQLDSFFAEHQDNTPVTQQDFLARVQDWRQQHHI